jgi:hypothetical protein
MAVRKIKVEDAAAARAERTRPVLAGHGAKATRSPALELQAQLSADLDAQSRWPPLATLGLIFGTCGGFWAAVAWGVSRLAL